MGIEREAGRSNRVIFTEMEEISVVVNPMAQNAPLSPSYDSDISRSSFNIFLSIMRDRYIPDHFFPTETISTTYPCSLLSVTNKSVSHDSSMEDITRL